MHQRLHVTENALAVALIFLVIALPLPFGSVTDAARLPLVLTALLIFAAAAATHVAAPARRRSGLTYAVWSAAGVLLLLVGAAQLIPLPQSVLVRISPASSAIWAGAEEVHSHFGAAGNFPQNRPVSVAPSLGVTQTLTFAAYFAIFQSAFLLIRHHRERLWLAIGLSAIALFEFTYGLQQLYRGKVTVWGWDNPTAYQRVTGTYVNPNHYANLLAVILPIALYLAVSGVARRSRRSSRWRDVVRRFFERGLVRAALGFTVAMTGLAGILIAQSRGALFSLVAAFALVGGGFTAAQMLRGRAANRLRYAAAGGVVVIVLVLALVVLIRHFGFQQTIARFEPLPEERTTLVGRSLGMCAAFDLWRRFPLSGSGLGTFGEVVFMTQPAHLNRVFTHAHNDYLEIVATTGATGIVILILMISGYVILWRDILKMRLSAEGGTERLFFLLAAIGSLTVFALHSVIDFNLFIPANAGTAAALAGAAAAAARQIETDETV